ncbi:uncharacterized protein LOC131240102 [Magnolia sinica]|uniref:uncharacterized protein LOC131240102 n=1 Tax=Magnolia sinica TaxID=86752 RepID=UPI002657BADA|nr:uncharacterized protein LOC131240102 [Magnolia sinica]
MSFNRRERLSPSCRLVSKENANQSYRTDDRFHGFNLSSHRDGPLCLRCCDMGLFHELGKKAAAVFPKLGKDDRDAEQSETESQTDQNECLWLSSGCISPSLLKSNDHWLHDAWDHDWWDLSLNDRFFSVLSVSRGCDVVLDGRISIFDGSRINPLEEAALFLDRTPDDIEKVCEEDLQVGEVVAWLHNSLEYEIKDSSFASTESAESLYEHSLYEDSSVFDSSWTSSLSTCEDSSSSQICNFDRTGIWLSLLDLEGEDFEWASDKVQDFDVFHSDFPSPSYHIKRPHIESSDSNIPSFSDRNSSSDFPAQPASEAKDQFICDSSEDDLEGYDADEPLFWPFDRNSYWHPEIEWNCLCISPRRNIQEIAHPESFFAPKSIRLRLPERKGSMLQRRVQEGYTRRIVFKSRSPVSNVMGFKTKDGNNDITGIRIKPSRLRHSTQGSSEQHSYSISLKKRPLMMKENPSSVSSAKVVPLHLQSQCQLSGQDEFQLNKNMNNAAKKRMEKPTKIKHDEPKVLTQLSFEASTAGYQRLLVEGFDSNKDVPIEAFIGLNEFNGHEGIDAEFDESRFSLDGSL